MKKLLTLFTIITLVFLSCDEKSTTDNDNNNTAKSTTLEIKNRSSYDLLQVSFGGVEFGTISSGKELSKNVTAGTRSVFFYLKSPNGNVYCRTNNVINCKADEKNEFVFIDNTLIEIVDGNMDTLSVIFDEISITSSSLELILNGNIFEQTKVYDFDYVIIGKKSEVEFSIKNIGQEDLIIGYGGVDPVYIENNSMNYFSVTKPSLTTIKPGFSTSFKVIFNPIDVGINLNAIVHIKNNSRINGNFFFTVKGSSRNYLVGDTGPAGGLIYYDKGKVEEGWRFLEAAPVSTEFTAQWGGSNTDISIFALNNATEEDYLILPWMTLSTLGSGKDNTNLIIAVLNQKGETGYAALRCKNLLIGGYNDWFLPSANDFIYIDNNLKRKGLGGFGAGDYWSSSQVDSSSAKSFNFSTYKENSRSKASSLTVRAVRSF